ncbi:hypothetical protein C7H19_24010 [Aphanothece hegewaldii CCALA 016]|uniref:Leucine-rich repeat domain-containing protein n=1 Tax=Aphanothece hegewaldii CCALA 016 TaxID=2107694 RepID=A0A2T1LR53_9CHRO|nr:hypothetical protein [Aphanothece hegewaldii]PSF30073.1 hypothetical protein C7H19_24010 [Aphanothece hegewaldii CCALA 016]
MINKKLIASLSLVPWAAMLAFLPFPESSSERVEAFPSQQVPVEYENQIIGSVEMPDWNYFSFSDFEPVLTSGSINSSEYDVNEVGYDLSRQWNSGDRIESILTLGDLEEIMDAQQFSLDNISEITGDDLSLVSLDQFPLLGQSTLSELVNTIPQWQNLNLRVKNVPALAKLLNGQTIPGIKAGPNQRVAKVLKWSKFANLSFSQMPPEMQQTLNITQVIPNP